MKHLKACKLTHFIFTIVTASQAQAYLVCKDLFAPVKTGVQILIERDQKLHTSQFVEKASLIKKNKTGITLKKPADKVEAFIEHLSKLQKLAQKSESALNKLKTSLLKQHVIKAEDIPESYYASQAQIYRERGYGDIKITPEQKSALAERVIKDQEKSLEPWIDYLVSTDTDPYPMWIKYWIFTGMTKLGKFNLETATFANRDKSTVAPYPELSHEVLALTVDAVLKYTNKSSLKDLPDIDMPEFYKVTTGLSFGKIFGFLLAKTNSSTGGKFLTNKGVWIKYKQGSDHTPLVKSLEGKHTGWCTVGDNTARSQLAEGDFHVFYSYDEKNNPTVPRVAIRMSGDEIGEVRGVAERQNLDSQINQSSVVSEKLTEFGDKADRFVKRDHDMKLLTSIEKKHNQNQQLTKDEILFLYEINENIQGFGYAKDPRIAKIISERNIKSDIMHILDGKYTEKEISTTKEEFLKGKSKIHFGDLYLSDFDLRILSATDEFKMPEGIYGKLDLSHIERIKNLIFPETINYNLSTLTVLKYVEVLKLPKNMHSDGWINLASLKSAKNVIFPETVNYTVMLDGLTSAEGLVLPRIMNNSLLIRYLKSSIGLNLPETINGILYIDNIESAKNLKMPKGVEKYMGPNDIQR